MSLGDLHKVNWDHPHVLPIFASFLLVIFGFFAMVVFLVSAIAPGNHLLPNGAPYLYFFFACVIAILIILIASITTREKAKPRPVYRSFEIQKNGIAAETTPKASGILSNSKLLGVVITTVGLIVVALIQFQPWQHGANQSSIQIAGIVEDLDTKAAIEQAEVMLIGIQSRTSDDHGVFKIEAEATKEQLRDLQLRVTKKGYKIRVISVSPISSLRIQLSKE